jgi:Raf kinase inhibitor-like YbhB/YbcL family protein
MAATKVRSSAKPAVLAVTSPAFQDSGDIPGRYAGVGENLSPALSWSTLPEGSASIAILCEDPDAPGGRPFSHWVLFNVPSSLPGIPEGIAPGPDPEGLRGASQGVNDFGRVGYDGPAPPRGHGPHRYRFEVYALDERLDLPSGVDASAVHQRMKAHVVGKGVLVGRYSR